MARWGIEPQTSCSASQELNHSATAAPHKLSTGCWDLASCQVLLSSVQPVSEEKSKNVSANQRPGRPSCFYYRPGYTNLVEDIEILLPVKFCWIPFSEFQRSSWNMSQPIRGQGGHLVFIIGPKNTNLVEDVEILLPVKFRWIPFNSSEEKSKMSQPIRGQGGHLVFTISPKNFVLVGWLYWGFTPL